MRIAALTYAYNENVNLKIWRQHYGQNFGEHNLYIFDRESDDGSMADIGQANRIPIPRIAFDDVSKSIALSSMHTALLQSFDCVVVTDCDEIILPDPLKYESLNHYITETRPIVRYCVGLNLMHVLTLEGPLDFSRPILSQRKIAKFARATSKPLISSVPTVWQPGSHLCNISSTFDSDIFLLHLKTMDYNISMQRQEINNKTEWSRRSLENHHGAHHRYDSDRFVHESFLDVINVVRSGNISEFDFEKEIKSMTDGMRTNQGVFELGEAPPKYVEIPERFAKLL